jgi:glycosyltransferase involved in cell wall biosynthesis
MTRDLDLLMVLDYYTPYVSGLTNVARDVAEGLAERGHRVRVLAGRHDRSLPERETVRGVQIERAPVLARLGKGLISPELIRRAIATSANAGVTNLHLPMPEGGLIAVGCRSPLMVTYHCDVSMPPGLVNRLQSTGVDLSSRATLRRAARVVATSEDYARHSRLWPAMDGKLAVIPPPCQTRDDGSPTFRQGSGLHVGFLGRIVEEKGLQYLVRGFQALGDPDSRLLIAGEFAEVAGGSVIDEVRRVIADDDRITLLGFLPEEQLADFYASLDVFALPSVNSFEAFGIVQVEAMTAGVPVLASDLPGVRVPVQETGFGVIVPPRDVPGIAAGLKTIAAGVGDRRDAAEDARRRYGTATVVDAYADLLAELTH